MASRGRRARAAGPAWVVQAPSHPRHGKHVEVDLSRQVMVLMRGRRVYRVYGVSSGKASTPTVLGRFRIYSQDHRHELPSGWSTELLHRRLRHPRLRLGPDLSGQPRMRARADPNARSIYHWLRLGDRVDVYP